MMGISEEDNPPLEIENQNEIDLAISSEGSHHDVVVDDGDDHDQNQNPPTVEESAIVEQLDNLELQSNVDDAADEVRENERESEEEEEEKEDEEEKFQNYPLRPNATDCAFYIKTGACKYGLNCRFNHPYKRVVKAVGEREREKGSEELNELVVSDTKKIECKYFSTPGGCKYGDVCRYNHPSEEIEVTEPELNFLGLPIRPMEKECTFFMRTGTCAYGAKCRFNHPDPRAANDSAPGNSLANGYSLRPGNGFSKTNEPMHSSGVLRGTLTNGMNSRNSLPYAPNVGSYHQDNNSQGGSRFHGVRGNPNGTPQNPGWNQNQVTVSLSTNKPTLPHQIVDFSKKQDPSTNYERLMQIEEFPERPGQPDCDYFMKTGDCKYRSACRYNHPISRSSRLPLPPPSSNGLYSRYAKVSRVETLDLHNSYSGNARKNGMRFDTTQKMQNGRFPERPGQPECEYFMKTGNCKFKSECRYHHPRNRVPSSSPCALNEKGLPLRPGAKICRNYEHQGTCQFGIRCLFHHPDNVSPAAQVAAEDHHHIHPSTNVAVASLEPPVSNNVESNWDDGWVM